MTTDIIAELDRMESQLSHFMNDRMIKEFKDSIQNIRDMADGNKLYALPIENELGVDPSLFHNAVLTDYTITSGTGMEPIEIELCFSVMP